MSEANLDMVYQFNQDFAGQLGFLQQNPAGLCAD